MRSPIAGYTPRGRAFFAAGVAAALFALVLGQTSLLSVGALLILLPLLSALAASRSRYRIRCVRHLVPARVAAGQNTTVSLHVGNVSRLPTGLLLAEDTIPYSLGTRPRFVLDGIQPGSNRTLTYQLQPDHRGRYTIGPLRIRVADAFGLVRLGSTVAGQATLVVTPAVTALPRTALAGTWIGAGGTRATFASAAGEDDVVPRPYRDGDELRRVHWRSTARHGELMVRREEQHWRNRVVLLLDARASAHAGRGPASSFEYAVSAAASIGVHLSREGLDGAFVTDTGEVARPGPFEDMLLDTLAVIQPSRSTSLHGGLTRIPRGGAGLLVAVLGQVTAQQAQELAARRAAGPAMAVLLAVSTWATQGPAGREYGETDAAAGVLTAAGWRVTVATEGAPLGQVWEELTNPGGHRVPSASAPRGVLR